jgi:hypothetical protein
VIPGRILPFDALREIICIIFSSSEDAVIRSKTSTPIASTAPNYPDPCASMKINQPQIVAESPVQYEKMQFFMQNIS